MKNIPTGRIFIMINVYTAPVASKYMLMIYSNVIDENQDNIEVIALELNLKITISIKQGYFNIYCNAKI